MKNLKDPRIMTVPDLQREVRRLRKRLEMTHHYEMVVNGDAIKFVKHKGFCGYDAVATRDATIAALERKC